jgi:hypothetical protein
VFFEQCGGTGTLAAERYEVLYGASVTQLINKLESKVIRHNAGALGHEREAQQHGAIGIGVGFF